MRKIVSSLKINPQPINRRFLRFGIGLLALFLIFTFIETIPIASRYDPDFTTLLQTAFPRIVDLPFSVFSLFGSFEITSVIVLALMFIGLKMEKKIIWSIGFLFAAILVFELIGKYFLFHPGPPKDYFRYSLPFSISTVHLSTNYAYPSGHVSRTLFLSSLAIFMIARYIKINWQKKLAIATIFVLTIIMTVSRIYLGEHWTTDVLGGILLGTSMGLLALVYY